jgi:diguanylate cyclase (GGDEF)-like protein
LIACCTAGRIGEKDVVGLLADGRPEGSAFRPRTAANGVIVAIGGQDPAKVRSSCGEGGAVFMSRRLPVVFWLFALVGLLAMVAHRVAAAAGGSDLAGKALNGSYQDGGWLDMVWIGASTMLGLAVLHPSMKLLGERTSAAGPAASMRRLALLALASLLAPLTLAIQALRGADLHPLVVAASCAALFILVVARLGAMVAEQRRTAITDALTGLHTRRYFEEALGAECARAVRSGEPLSMVLLDVDHFKKVNDTHGHHAGDLVLGEVAARMRAAVRAGDVVARYGGEEFAVLLPRTSPADAYSIAERLREAIAAAGMTVTSDLTIPVTVSLGVAAVPVHAVSAGDLVLTADRLLYDSKETGRNRVTTPDRASTPSRVSRTT